MSKLHNNRLPLFGALISIALFLGTVYLWYDFWQANKMKANVEQSVFVPRKSEPVKNQNNTTSTANNLANSVSSTVLVNTSTPVKSTSNEPRVAVSPLTGTLVLAEGDVNLDVPYTSQAPEKNWEEPWQNACEEAAVLMLDAYIKGYGLSPLSAKDELQRMVNWEKERNWFTSIKAADVQKLFTEYLQSKNKVTIVENPTVAQIKKYLDAGKPILALANGKTLGNKYYANGGPDYHAFIIRGYTKDSFITNDPGVNRGANFVFPIKDVMTSLHDWNSGDVKNGTPVIIVIE